MCEWGRCCWWRWWWWTGTEGPWAQKPSCIIYERRVAHLEIKHLLICQKHKQKVPLTPAFTFNWWEHSRRDPARKRHAAMKVSFQERLLFISVCFSLCAVSPQTETETPIPQTNCMKQQTINTKHIHSANNSIQKSHITPALTQHWGTKKHSRDDRNKTHG